MCTHVVRSFQTNPVELTLTANEKQLSTKLKRKFPLFVGTLKNRWQNEQFGKCLCEKWLSQAYVPQASVIAEN